MSRNRNLKKFATINGKRFYTRDARTALAIEEQATVTTNQIASSLTNIDSTSIKITCTIYDGFLTPGSIVSLHDIQADGTIRVKTAANAEDIIGVYDAEPTSGTKGQNDIVDITIEGYVENMRAFYSPTATYSTSPDPGDDIYVYEGFYSTATGYDTSGIRLGWVVGIKWGAAEGAVSNQTRVAAIFESPTNNRSLNDGIRAGFAQRSPARSVGTLTSGTLLVSDGADSLFGTYTTPNLRAFVAGTDDPADIVGMAPYDISNNSGFGFHMNGLANVVVASGTEGAAVYAVAGGGTLTTDSTSGVRVGTILTSDPGNATDQWVIKTQF